MSKIEEMATTAEYNGTSRKVFEDAFIEKAKKWFEEQNEWHDPNGNRHCDMDDFEDFKNYMKGE